MLILDTNVLSEVLRRVPEPAVERWLAAQDGTDVYLTAITEAELRRGAAIMPAGRRKDGIAHAIDAILTEDFQGRILPFDSAAASAYAVIAAERQSAGRPISHFDAQIAAIARARSGIVVTRNTADFTGCGVVLINPWIDPLSP
ncbi:type II toxin-antitoxin system VapC family toxin [Rhodospirillum centenum]|uniref:Ribonuclease VapC n=1 Tax=Rhodospirillum centenum (strain ATCC 51521 / SW) TaxID=414684 RepID=B6IXN7_RHOCS|nr:type II toxin-antitoxin system VapC family toxin [Rhodospirillum centenum]ACJ01061.1 conserved hypothetical protein [Rhodospirillum centenum SW]